MAFLFLLLLTLPLTTGSRGGKRSVTHLSIAQLARKRANDREAQRQIRQRNKDRVCLLENRITLLEKREQDWSERVCQLQDAVRFEYQARLRSDEENRMLRAQLGQEPQQQAPVGGAVVQQQQQGQQRNDQALPVVQSGVLISPEKFEQDWVPGPSQGLPVSTYAPADQIFPTAMSFEDPENSQQVYAVTAAPTWDGSEVFEHAHPNMQVVKADPAWASFDMAIDQEPARYGNTNTNSSTTYPVDINVQPLYSEIPSWPAQPSPPTGAWQCATKLRAPVTQLDHLVMAVVDAHLSSLSSTDDSNRQLLSADLPPVQALISPPGNSTSPRLPPALSWVMKCYNTLLSTRGFSLHPERLASFIVMYRFVQWQTTRSDAAYKCLYEWQRPCPAQLAIPHPQWMDFLPWPKLRERVINDQERYDSMEFQRDYATNLRINFPYHPSKTVVNLNGQLKVTELMERHLADLNVATMMRPFAEKYPELADVCRFEEV